MNDRAVIALRDATPESCRIAATARIHPNVRLGENVVVEDFCVIGYPPRGIADGGLETSIGAGTHIRTHCIIYAGVRVGSACHIGHTSLIREHTVIGDSVSIGINALIEHHAAIGDRVRIQGRVGIGEYTIIEHDAWIGPAVITTNALHPTCERAKECLSGPIIRSFAIIGAGVTISPDVEVGSRAFIGSGSAVIKTVPEEAVMFGVPARRMGTVRRLACPYEMLESGMSPYDPARPRAAPRVPLVDLGAQHQAMKQDVRLAIDRVLLNSRFDTGRDVAALQADFAHFAGLAHVRAVNSVTRAVWIALLALDVKPGDEVILPASTEPAVAEAIALAGASSVFAPVLPGRWVIDPDEAATRVSPRTRVIVAADTFGLRAPLAALRTLADAHGLRLLAYAGPVAAPGWGAGGADCVCFSFHPGAMLSAYGAAGAVGTDDPALAERIGALRDAGLPGRLPADGGLDALQASVLGMKLRHAAEWAKARRAVATAYLDRLAGLALDLPVAEAGRVWHRFVVGTDDPGRLIAALALAGVDAVATGPDLRLVALPLYPEMTEHQLTRIIAAVRAAVRG